MKIIWILVFVLFGCQNPAECKNDFAPCSDSKGVCLSGECIETENCGSDCSKKRYLPDTSLRVCYGPSEDGADGTIECPSEAGSQCAFTDYCGQDAQYGWDTQNTPDLRFNIDSDGAVVVDKITDYFWQKCSAGQSEVECLGQAETMNWYQALDYCATLTAGGYQDWRLPDRYEIQSIVDYSRQSPVFDEVIFINSPSKFHEIYEMWWSECYWSVTDYSGDSDVAWALLSNSGDISEGSGYEYHLNDKLSSDWDGCYVRCIRGDSEFLEKRRYIVSSAGTTGDLSTGLVWQRCSFGEYGDNCEEGEALMLDWKSSLAYCENLSLGGKSDWRLPNIIELVSIIDSSRKYPSIDTEAFPNTPFYGELFDNNAGQYWSSTARNYNSFALYADFSTGFSHFYIQSESRHVRCVRN
ncbi:MAG: DUF1566 domain-containing protein [Deltaproteobacteria bacterium]|nr:DUF1566 domain-containing protein [Deltaproteobacteria bacterium]